MCACGLPLHYSSSLVEEVARQMVADLGEEVELAAPGGVYMVQRHYIALHGIRALELAHLERVGVVRRKA